MQGLVRLVVSTILEILLSSSVALYFPRYGLENVPILFGLNNEPPPLPWRFCRPRMYTTTRFLCSTSLKELHFDFSPWHQKVMMEEEMIVNHLIRTFGFWSVSSRSSQNWTATSGGSGFFGNLEENFEKFCVESTSREAM